MFFFLVYSVVLLVVCLRLKSIVGTVYVVKKITTMNDVLRFFGGQNLGTLRQIKTAMISNNTETEDSKMDNIDKNTNGIE